MIIISNVHAKTLVSKILSHKLLVWTGLISYSLYLWHWPVLVFGRTVLGNGVGTKFFLISISFFLAWMTYKYIETPFREKTYLPNRAKPAMTLLASICIIFVIGFTLFKTKEILVSNLPTQNELIDKVNGPRWRSCFREKTLADLKDKGPCLLGIQEDTIEPTFVLWGDSHAGAMIDSIDTLAKEHQVKCAIFSVLGCHPARDSKRKYKREYCLENNKSAQEYIFSNNIKNVLIVVRWDQYTNNDITNFHEDRLSDEVLFTDLYNNIPKDIQSILFTFNEKNIHTTILKQVPRHPYFSKRNDEGYDELRKVSASDWKTQNSFLNYFFDELTLIGNVSIVDPIEILCPNDGECLTSVDNKLIYKDDDHLNHRGTNLIMPLFEEFMISSKQ